MNSVLSKTGTGGYKKSMRHSALIPDTALFDPLLLNEAGYLVTAASGWDAVTQLLEAAVSTKANRLTDHYSFAGLAAASSAFPKVCSLAKNPSDGEEAFSTRLKMALAAFYGGIALANAGLGLVHGAASPLGAIKPVPHGVVCGLLLPPVTRAILKRLDKGEGGKRYAAAGYLLSCKAVCEAEAFALCSSDRTETVGQGLLLETLEEWKERFPLPSFSEYGFTSEDLESAAEKSAMKNSPSTVSAYAVLKIFESCSGRNG
jgi:alcohol dehydrogenase class IV